MELKTEQMIIANIALDVLGIILTMIPIVYLINGKRYKYKRLNTYFFEVAVSNVFMILGDLSDWMFQRTDEQWEKAFVLGGAVLFYTASAFVLHFFARYITTYIQLEGKARKVCSLSVSVVSGVQVFFALISPFTGSIFYVTDCGYQRGSLFWISQIVPLYCYLLFTVLVILYHRKMGKREVMFLLFYIFVPLGGGALQMFHRGIAVVNIGVTLALLFIFVNIQFEHELLLQKREKELAEQNIDIMFSQIQPHFLYNSLSVIYNLCETNPAAAKISIRKFSDFLRGNMDSLKSHEPIPFEKELRHVMNFLYLEQQRFGDRLKIIYQIEMNDFFIPPLSLQPLVENAIQHGILHKKEGGTIIIRTVKTDGYVIVAIIDDGVGMEQAGRMPDLGDHAHIGISNARSRLEEMMHGSLEIKSNSQGTSAIIRIPM